MLLPIEGADEFHELQIHVLRLLDNRDDPLTTTGGEDTEEQERQYRQIKCPA